MQSILGAEIEETINRYEKEGKRSAPLRWFRALFTVVRELETDLRLTREKLVDAERALDARKDFARKQYRERHGDA